MQLINRSNNHSQRYMNNAAQMRGGSLIEILVSLLLVAFGFLGIGAMFNFSLSANKSASSRLVATMLAQDYADMARSNPIGFRANAYNNSVTSYSPTAKTVSTLSSSNLCSYPNCTAATAATDDIERYKQRVKALLSAGDFVATRATVGNTDAMDIWILWIEGKNVADTNANNDVCPQSVKDQTPAPDPFPRCLYVRVAL